LSEESVVTTVCFSQKTVLLAEDWALSGGTAREAGASVSPGGFPRVERVLAPLMGLPRTHRRGLVQGAGFPGTVPTGLFARVVRSCQVGRCLRATEAVGHLGLLVVASGLPAGSVGDTRGGRAAMSEIRRTVDRMLAALQIEQTAIEKSTPRAENIRRANSVRHLSGEGQRYTFRMAHWPDSWRSWWVLVRTGKDQPWLSAEVESVTHTDEDSCEVRIEAATSLPPGARTLDVREDEAAALRTLTGRLGELASAPGDRVRLAMAVVGAGTRTGTGLDRRTTAQVLAAGETRWNPEQERAIGQALGSELTFVWGPAGTGKTAVLAAVIEGCYRQGHRVLLLSPTHVAVDQALLRVCERLQHEPDFDRGLVHRHKGARLSELNDRFGPFIDPEEVQGRLAARLEQRAEQLKEENHRLSELAGSLQELAVAERAVNDLTGEIRTAQETLTRTTQHRQETEQHLETLDRTIAAVGAATGVVGAWRRRRTPDLLHRRETAQAALHRAVADAEGCAHRLTCLRDELDRNDQRRTRLHETIGTPRPALPAVQQSLTGVENDAQRVKNDLTSLGTSVRAVARITATTVAAAVADRSLQAGYDVVVLDEAGMVDLASAFTVTALAGCRVVVAGDFRQLPAVVKADPDRLQGEDRSVWLRWFARDVFAAAGTVTEDGVLVGDERLVALREQYRMRPAICDLVNLVAYPDKPLRTGRPDTSRVPSSPLLSAPLVLIDTSDRVIAQRRNVNPVHAAAIRELVRGLQYDTVLPARREAAADPARVLAVIAPYRDQVRAVRRQMAERFGAEHKGVVDTVHRFQGSERPVVVLDTVSGGDRLGWFYRGTGLASQTCRLLNVAVSRAQDHLVVVADVSAFERLAPARSEVRTMMQHLRSHAQVLPVTDLIPIRSAAELAGLSDAERGCPAFFPVDEVIPAIEWDISRARERLDLFCPFLNARATKRWIGPLGQAVARGIRVVVTTRDHDPEDAQTRLCEQLREAGVVVVTAREAMHEKVLIVDDVLWHGSLNLLAHVRSTELMMRLASVTAVEQVRRIVDRARPARPATPYERRTSAAPGAPGGRLPPDTPERVYLQVPYSEKDLAKQEKARWDPTLKLWYIDPTLTSRDRVARWLPGG
jgi:hypothetical protein